MNGQILQQKTTTSSTASSGKNLYLFGCLAALAIVALYLLDMSIPFAGGDTGAGGTLTAVEWFGLLQSNPVLGLRALGLMNIISLTFGIVLFFALYAIHKGTSRNFASYAFVIFLLGAAIYISNNGAIPMAVLSSKFAEAASTQRNLIAAAGEAVLARGEDFTPGSFLGFFFTEVGSFFISIVMLKGSVFTKTTAYAGILGSTLMAVFTVLATLVSAAFDAAMIIAMIGGLLSIAWYILTARRLFQLNRESI